MQLSIILSALLAGSITTSAEQHIARAANPAHGSEQQVLAVIDQLTSAGLKRDVAALDRLYAEDYFHTNADGSLMNKEDVMRSYREPPKVAIDASKHDDDRIQVHGDLVVVSSRITVTGRDGEKPFTRYYRVTYVLRKDEGRWLVANSHASLLAR